jgi:spore maturation protein CgeB
MRIALFYHSLESDWNHGNAHFLRGYASELVDRGDPVSIFEPADSWSRANLVEQHGASSIDAFAARYPALRSTRYDLANFDLDAALDGVSLAIVHEWNSHELVRRIGEHHRRNREYALLFHDTHHRSITDPHGMAAYDLRHYDGVLAFGEAIRQVYLQRGWAGRVWTWHEAADTRVFHPIAGVRREGDLIWIGNWGDNERTRELREFLLEPVKALGLRARMYGVRYPAEALADLREAGVEYAGWLPNFEAPRVFAKYRVTMHVPRRPYAEALPGIPTIRPFEALACGIPLMCAPWRDTEGLFTPGKDFLIARNGTEMQKHLRDVLNDPALAAALTRHGLETILARHTCAHRVDELLSIYGELRRQRSEGAA